MAQTKRKRRSKHRGNAAGTIEVRGRTGRKPAGDEGRKATGAVRREERMYQEPTMRASVIRAGLAAVVLFVLFEVGIGPQQNLITSLALALGAFALYVPIGYWTDRFVWKRRMRKAGRPIPTSSSGGGRGGRR